MPRRFQRLSVDQMKEVFRANHSDPIMLGDLADELACRTTTAAIELKKEVNRRILTSSCGQGAKRDSGTPLSEADLQAALETDTFSKLAGLLPEDSVQAEVAKSRIADLRQRLLDLSNRNRLLNFKHSARSVRYVRIIDESAIDLFQQLQDDKSVELVPLPPLPDEPEDESSDAFREALEEALLTDKAYLKAVAKIEALGTDDAESRVRIEERTLRDRLRKRLHMPTRANLELSVRDHALHAGLNPEFELSGRHILRKRPAKRWQTLLSDEELSRRLRSIEAEAREARQEYGVDTLYFVFGFLEWTQPTTSADAEEVLFAPLILQPANIAKRTVGGGSRVAAGRLLLDDDSNESTTSPRVVHIISASDAEEPSTNLTLRERLRLDLGFSLPELDSEEPNLEIYFAQVEQAIRGYPKWRVRRFVTLTHLSFSRLPMWRDLDPDDPNKPPPHVYPILGELLGGSETSHRYDDSEGPRVDVGPPKLVLDCDSSQYAAIKQVLSGRNMVIQGPPGTGKSQTIANLIGAALGEGKSVLFVAEKQVALEVVHKRLSKVGLGDYLLELHSAKAGKKPLLESVRCRLSLRRPRVDDQEAEEARRHHRETEKVLNAYAEAMGSTYGAIGWTLHDLIWREINFRHFQVPESLRIFAFDDVHLWTKEDWATRRDVLSEWSQAVATHQQEIETNHGQHPWGWVYGRDLHVTEQQRIVHFAHELHRQLGTLGSFVTSAELDSTATPQNLSRLFTLNEHMKQMGSRPITNRAGIWSFARNPESRAVVDNILTCVRTREESVAIIRGIAPKALIEIQLVDERLRRFATILERLLDPKGIKNTIELGTQALKTNERIELLPTAQDTLKRLGVAFQLPGIETSIDGLQGAVAFLEMAAEVPQCIIGRRTDLGAENATNTLHDAFLQAQALAGRMENLESRLAVSLDTVSIEEVAGAIKELDGSWPLFPWLFSSAFRKAKRLINRLSPNLPSTGEIPLLRDIQNIFIAKKQLAEHPAIKLTGGAFSGGTSSMNELGQLAKWVGKVRACTPVTNPFSLRIRGLLWSPSQDLCALASQLAEAGWIEKLQDLTAACVSAQTPLSALLAALEGERSALVELGQLTERWAWSGPLDEVARTDFRQAALRILSADVTLTACSKEVSILLPDPADACEQLTQVERAIHWARQADLPAAWYERVIAEEGASDWLRLRGLGLELQRLTENTVSVMESLRIAADIPDEIIAKWKVLPLHELMDTLQSAIKHEGTLSTRCRLLASESAIEAKALNDFVERASGSTGIIGGIAGLFDRIAVRSLCGRAFDENATLRPFRHKSPTIVRDKFRRFDEEQKAHDRKALVTSLFERPVPAGISIGRVCDRTERALLDYVCDQQRPRTSVRELMRRSGRALQALKPCFMMSPLSVAQLIERGTLVFDLVVFDEASQIRPEDALCALTRAKQFVVVGDGMQLPPTSFGVKSSQPTEADIDDEGDDAPVDESVLELASSSYGSGVMLLWHYRSLDQSLIAYSNREFYESRLQVFPAPHIKSAASGVRYVAVPGVYSARTNVIEARVCAQAAVEYMKRHPKRSLGIVALNKPQAELIELEIDRLIDQHTHAQEYRAYWDDGIEPLFVKNLESVQGDERDTIFISTVFGNDVDGNFFQRFGPINSMAGHRRLNVLFTRAKHQVVVFSSIPIEKITISPESHWGARALKGYLEYAKTGQIATGRATGKSADSPFEEAVRTALKQAGFECEAQVGVAGFFIDLAVINPANSDRFILGIECDGASYHSSRSARDRDRLRQEILENLGWTIVRVWSTDWFNDSQRELYKLLEQIRDQVRKNPSAKAPSTVNFEGIIQRVSSGRENS